MTYRDAVYKINSLLRFGMKPGLERIQALLDRMGNPQKQLKFVHVAGTNGKGSACALLSSVLREAGYRTGLFTSPYITDFRERFQINGEEIPEETLARILGRLMPMVEEMAERGEVITEFELITALAFQWFYEEKCDVVVLEVGLGGRFDATNVIDTPLAAVIMSISLDHTAILGDTVEQIAFEKCGIVKEGGDVVLYPDQEEGVYGVVAHAVQNHNGRLVLPSPSSVREVSSSIEGTVASYRDEKYQLPFLGAHQLKNAAAAFAALELLKEKGYRISREAMQAGVARAYIPARMEVLGRSPLVILDGAHNPGAARVLAQALEKYLPHRKIIGVMGMLKDKDSRSSLRSLASLFQALITASPKNPRALPAAELADRAREYCSQVFAEEELSKAICLARKLAGEDGAIVICGSLYLAGEIRPLLLNGPAEKENS